MSYLGVHFALSNEDVVNIRALSDEQERLSYLQEEIEERYLVEPVTYAAESDKAWDAMHRALTEADSHGMAEPTRSIMLFLPENCSTPKTTTS